MNRTRRAWGTLRFAPATLLLWPATAAAAPVETAAAPATPLRFTVTYDPSITDRYTGRVYVMLLTSDRREPRTGPSWMQPGAFFAVDVSGWKPNTPLTISGSALGYPGPIKTLPRQTWSIQAVMRRSLDSPTIGQGPGSAHSIVVRRELDGGAGAEVALRIDRVVEAKLFPESNNIRLLEIRSELLSAFHGRNVMLRAAVMLPDGYEQEPDRHYPALYFIGGFGSDHFRGPAYRRRFSGVPGMDDLVMIVPDPLCRNGHHAFADSANNGPYGRALVEELMPALENAFRLVTASGGRFLSGGSSGGWSSLWLQVTYPDMFGGVWSLAPDPVDFRAFQLVDIYTPGANVYRDEHGERRPIMRRGDQVRLWYDDFAHMDRVMGEGGQLGSFEAVFSPRGPDGRPKPLFDRDTGEIDAAVAEAWRSYDIRLVLDERWPELAPKLAGKVNVFVGDQDNFYLDGAVMLLKQWQEATGAEIVVEVHPDRSHMTIYSRELLTRIVAELLESYHLSAP